VLVLAVKTQDAEAALVELGAPSHVPVVCFTNGLAAERIALRRAREVYGACVSMPASYLVAGVVQVWSQPIAGVIDVGRYPDGTGAHAEALCAVLQRAGFDSVPCADIMRWKRAKLLSNLANGIEALAGRASRESELAEAMRAEGRACYEAAELAYATEAERAARNAGYAVREIAGAARAGGSTWQSLQRGKRSVETDYLNGEIALLGRLHGVPTPINEAVQELVAEAARRGTPAGAMALDDLTARVRAR
jgi:2-dehydropantoate 2-reductase